MYKINVYNPYISNITVFIIKSYTTFYIMYFCNNQPQIKTFYDTWLKINIKRYVSSDIKLYLEPISYVINNNVLLEQRLGMI